MMKNWKKTLSWTTVAGVLTGFVLFADGVEKAQDWYSEFILKDHISGVAHFSSSSSIIDHRFDDGILYLKYRTCNPPVETPDYYYSVWIGGELLFHSQSVADHFSINAWFKPLYCTEGWWGNKGFEGAEPGDEVVVHWHWLLDDGSYEETTMRYIITER